MEQLVNKYKRLDYIDTAKALGMLTVMWGHIADGISRQFVYTFHMPLFFFLSGMVFLPEKYNGFGNFLKRKVETLLVPYVIYSFITWVIWAVYVTVTHQQVASIWMPLLQTFIAQGSDPYLVHNVPLWFPTCLFVTEVVYYWLSKTPDWVNVLICILLGVIGYELVTKATFYDFSRLPWNIEVMMMAIIFFALGHLLIKHLGHNSIISLIKKKKSLFLLLSLLLFCGVYIVAKNNGQISMGHASIKNPLWFYPGALIGITAMIIISVLFAGIHINTLKDAVCWFGSNSFIAMAIHNPIKGFLIAVVAKLVHQTPQWVSFNFLASFIVFLITLSTTVILMILIVQFKKKRNKWKMQK